ncbi:OLC1v1011956C1 [Oldenlandia corymbosa var. corymbosa]|uniref:OLC1v1011956C1 n=1 Tax=Oldenlandia corymbosa var. corymbosa TaxID=529605 RepID=A0AAV1DV03_OLDCO|nr:OLC1v1011956C1 [Oldenlandia corymbosa var. corymbosa]
MSDSVMNPTAVITCTAAVAWGAGEPLVMEEVQVSPPEAMEIRIKVVATSLCRSDITAWLSLAQSHMFPRIFGHEASGIVESVGQGVTEFEPGDHVLTLFTGECMRCRHCTSGKSNICQTLGLERRGVMHSDQKTRFSIKGRPIFHYCAVSSFSEYTVVHSGCAVKVSSTAPLERICLLSCGVSAGLGAAWKVANISEGSTVAIFGLGTVGLSVAQGAKLRGASCIIGVDTNPGKIEKAKTFGVTEFINPNECEEPIQQVIKRITGGGADYCFECVGDTEVITTALQCCSDGWGVTVTLGVPKANPEVAAHYALFLSGRTLKGSLFGGWKPKSDVPSLVGMYLNKEIEVDEMVTHDIGFEDINRAFDLMRDGKCLRCVIHPEFPGGISMWRPAVRNLLLRRRCLDGSHTLPLVMWSSSAATGRYTKGSRLSIWRRKKEIGKEGLMVAKELKRLQNDPFRFDRFLKSHVSRLLKSDLVSVLAEFQRQDLVLLSLKLYDVVRKEIWYRPDMFFYRDMLLMLARNKRVDEAAKVWDDLKSEGVLFDQHTFGDLIRAFLDSSLPNEAMQIYEEMRMSPDPPLSLPYRVILKGLLPYPELREKVKDDFLELFPGMIIYDPPEDLFNDHESEMDEDYSDE